MSDTEATRLELYNISKQKIDDRDAELFMMNLPHDPDRNATKDDVEVLGANVRAEMADVRTELRTGLAGVRTDLAELRTDVGAQIHDATAAQTRTVGFGLFGSVTAMAVANIVAAGILN